jgi:hypothetical protein
MGEVEREISASNAQVAAEEIEAAASRGAPSADALSAGSPFQFDPQGPEKAGEAAESAYGHHEWIQALELFVKAVDRLHDFYVYEQFRNRQPSPADAWLVQGVTKSLGVMREVRPEADVTDLVREATHRLRTISTAVANAGGEPVLYRRALDEMARLAPDVDVSDIFWE